MIGTAFRLHALALALLAAGASACGGNDNELVPLDDGLLEPPGSNPQRPSGSSSSSGSSTPPSGSGGASSSSSGSTPGQPAVEAPCDKNANYTEYVTVQGLPAAASWLRLTGDELHGFYAVPGAGTARIYSTQRAARDAAFEPGVELGAGVNLASVVSEPLPTDDGLILRYTVNGNSVYAATRASLAAPFDQATLAMANARSLVLARDGSLGLFARYDRVAPFGPPRWVVRGQPVGAGEKPFFIASPGADAFPTWYEPLSQQAWLAHADQTLIFTWNGEWHAAGATDFRVTWTTPNGCRLYGRHDGAIKMRSRVPSLPGAGDAGAGDAG